MFAGLSLCAVMREAQAQSAQQDCEPTGQVLLAAVLAAAGKFAEAKEHLIRRRRHISDEALIFADGFAIGLAFLMEVQWNASMTTNAAYYHM